MRRFLLYDSRLLHRDGRPIRTVVLYTGGILQAPDRLDAQSIRYQVQNVYLARFDGNGERRRIRQVLQSQTWLSPEDQVDLAFSILMRNEDGIYTATLEAMDMVPGIEDPVTQDFLLGCLVGLSDKFLTEEQRRTVRGRVGMTRIGQELIEEGRMEGVVIIREAILEALDSHFGPVPEKTRARVLATEDLTVLKSWLRTVVRAESAEEAYRQLQG